MVQRLRFVTPWPDSAVELRLVREATHAFEGLRGVLRRMHDDGAGMHAAVDLGALHVWATVHGPARVMNGQCVDRLALDRALLKQAVMQSTTRAGLGVTRKN